MNKWLSYAFNKVEDKLLTRIRFFSDLKLRVLKIEIDLWLDSDLIPKLLDIFEILKKIWPSC